jgi:hypothetical protein
MAGQPGCALPLLKSWMERGSRVRLANGSESAPGSIAGTFDHQNFVIKAMDCDVDSLQTGVDCVYASIDWYGNRNFRN